MGRLSRAATARPTLVRQESVACQQAKKVLWNDCIGRRTCGNVEVEILVSPSSKKVAVRLAKSMPLPAGMDRIHSYQKPVDTAM